MFSPIFNFNGIFRHRHCHRTLVVCYKNSESCIGYLEFMLKHTNCVACSDDDDDDDDKTGFNIFAHRNFSINLVGMLLSNFRW